MGRTFSIATLLLAMAIAAVALASLRAVWVRGETGAVSRETVGTMIAAGAMAGMIFGAALAIWNKATSARRLSEWLRMIASTIGGFFLGAAAGAQFTAAIPWYGLLLLPAVIIGPAVLVAVRGRR